MSNESAQPASVVWAAEFEAYARKLRELDAALRETAILEFPVIGRPFSDELLVQALAISGFGAHWIRNSAGCAVLGCPARSPKDHFHQTGQSGSA